MKIPTLLRNHTRRIYALLACLIVSLLLAAPILAQTGGSFTLTWSALSSGGGSSSGGVYTLDDLVGESVTGISQAGDFTVTDGALVSSTEPSLSGSEVYIPLVIR